LVHDRKLSAAKVAETPRNVCVSPCPVLYLSDLGVLGD
jgi:hypothetical protein